MRVDSNLERVKAETRKFIYRAEYDQAIRFLKKKRREFPKEIYIQSMLATLPYEKAFSYSGKRRDDAFKKAAASLRPILRKLNGLPIEERMRNRNEYYWFSKQYKKQYELGSEGVRRKVYRSYYSQGVGAVHLGYEYLLKGSRKIGNKWILRAEKSWRQYLRHCGHGHNDAWLFLGLAQGLQGLEIEMEKSLKKAASLANLSYRNDPGLMKVRRMVKTARPRVHEIRRS